MFCEPPAIKSNPRAHNNKYTNEIIDFLRKFLKRKMSEGHIIHSS